MPRRTRTKNSHVNQLGKRPHNEIICVEFSEPAFLEAVRETSQVTYQDWSPNNQVAYLASYLASLNAKSLVIEHHYIDRHFIEEVSLYYSKSLLPRQNWTTRIHVFATLVDQTIIDQTIAEASSGNLSSATRKLQRGYCGYIVIRPLPSVPIGRTVLKHLSDRGERFFPTCYTYPVHFLGFKLTVHGLAFQQQDRAVGACATTAIWSALQRLTRREGARPPTSSEITQAAVRHYLPHGRPFPSSGLAIEQICEALRCFGFAPDLLAAHESTPATEFLTFLDIYLRSGIPLILAIRTGNEGHAVTVVGYASNKEVAPYEVEIGQKRHVVRIHNLASERIFIHDDRLGPYARAKFWTEDRCDGNGNPFEQLMVNIDWPNGQPQQAEVYYVAAPLYPKLRTSASELFEAAMELVPILSDALGDDQGQLGLVVHFERSGTYQSSLYERKIDSKRLVTFQKSIALSRYIGVHRWYWGDRPFMDTVWDTTDTMRETKYKEHLLGAVCLDSEFDQLTDEFAKFFDVVSG